MNKDNLFHADAEPDLSQSGQQPAVPSPLEIMAKAYNNEVLWWSIRWNGTVCRLYRGAETIADFSSMEEASLAMCDRRRDAGLRAALLALAEAELPDRVTLIYTQQSEAIFRAMLRQIASPQREGDRPVEVENGR